MTTQASPTTATVGVAISTLTDTATLTGGNSPTGTVTFGLYTDNTCTAAVTPAVGGTVALGGTSATETTSWTPPSPGTYYWLATYNGDANNSVNTSCGGSDPNEQITVNTAPGMTTQASPTSATVGVGITATDTATFVGTTSVAPTGDVTFTLFSDSNCSTTVPGVGGTGMIQTTGGVSTATYSVNWTPLTPGTYSWIASYPGDGNNQASETNCSDANEQITVNAASPGMTTKASPATATVGVAVSTLTDTATLTGGDSPTGTVTFGLYTDNTCTMAVMPAVGGTVALGGTSATETTSWTPPSPGTYYWLATYNGDANNSVNTSCGGSDPNEQITVNTASPGMTTQASPTSATVGVGITVTDTATLTGGDSPSGTVTFGLYTDTTCTTAVTPAVGGTVALSGTSATSSSSWTPSAAGPYYWLTTYNGDRTTTRSPVAAVQMLRVITVNAASPGMTTKASPATATVGVAVSTLTDTATLTGGDSPTGTVTFGLYTDNTCTMAVMPAVGGTVALGGTSATETTSWTPPSPGTYYWLATYNGDANNSVNTSCGGSDPNEQITVNTASPGMTTQASPTSATVGVGITVTDTATLTGGDSPSGTVTFGLYTDTTCTTAVTPAVGGTVALSGTSATSSSSWTPSAVGPYYWLTTYNGDKNNNPITSCGGTHEVITIGKASPIITTQASPATGTVGVPIAPVSDKATFSGTTALAPTGFVTFKLFSNSVCTSAPSVSGSGSIVTTSGVSTATLGANWTPPASGIYYWIASYAGDSNDNGFTTLCAAINEQVTINKATPAIGTVASPTTGTVGVKIQALKDTATLSGTAIAPTGSVTFTLYSNSTCTTAVTGVSGSGAISGSSASFSVKWKPAAAGMYFWIASYPGDANNVAVLTVCGSESVVVTAQPTISTIASPKSAGTGATIQDTATLANTSNLLGTGSITFSLFGPGDTGCKTALHTETKTAVNTNSPVNTTTGFVAKTNGTYQWTASFSGDANNAAASSKCGSDPVPVGPQVSRITPSATTCAQFASGFATGLSATQYTLNGTKVSTVTPPTFTYWVKVTSGGTLTITQSTSETSKKLLLAGGSAVYDNATASSCTTVTSTITQKSTSGNVTVKFSSGTGPFYIGLVFSTSKVVGETAPTPSTTVQYFFGAGFGGGASEIDLKFV